MFVAVNSGVFSGGRDSGELNLEVTDRIQNKKKEERKVIKLCDL